MPMGLGGGPAWFPRVTDISQASVNVATEETRYYNPFVGGANSTNIAFSASCQIARRTEVRAFRVKPYNSALVLGEFIDYHVMRNGAPVALTLRLNSGDSASAYLVSTGGPVTFEPGDTISVRGVASALAATRAVSILLQMEMMNQ